MRLPKLLRKLWMPFVAILILALIATIELREPFVVAATGRPPATTPPANRSNCGPNRCDVYGACPDSTFNVTTKGTDNCNSVCHDNYRGGRRTCPAGSTRVTPSSNTDFRCMKPRTLKPGCTRPT